jgi:hypothetical protein
VNTTTKTTKTRRAGRNPAGWARALDRGRGRRRRPAAARVARTRRACSAGTPSAWREPLLALLDYAELEVLDFPEERARVQSVRRALCAGFDRQSPPALDLRDLAFTFGLITTAMGSELSDHGLLSRCLGLLSPSAMAEYERARGFVRVGPPSRF